MSKIVKILTIGGEVCVMIGTIVVSVGKILSFNEAQSKLPEEVVNFIQTKAVANYVANKTLNKTV